MANVEWSESAVEDLQKLDKHIAKRIVNKISWFASHFEHITPEPLSGDFSGVYKIRIGDWRVIYAIESGDIVINAVGHRRDIYKL